MTKYIVFDNATEWCFHCWKEADDNNRVRFLKGRIPFVGHSILRWICWHHMIYTSKLVYRLPFTSLWFKRLEKAINIDDTCDTVLIVYDWSVLSRYFNFWNYLRKRHKRIKVVYLFSNVLRVTGANRYHIIDSLNKNYDLVFAFDKVDAEKHAFYHSPLIYATKNPLPVYNSQLDYDLFYLGVAKDRYDSLIEVFEKAKNEGLKCNFTIVGVDPEKRKYTDEIKYEPVSYQTALENMAKSKCLVDMIQGGSTALTIKTCEALALGKKLITSNYRVENEPFYHRENIMVYDKNQSLKEFMNKEFINYSNEDCSIFSPETLFEKIGKLLNK